MFDKERSPFTMTIKIGWGQAEKKKHLKKYAPTYWLLKAYEKCTNGQARRSYLSFIAQYPYLDFPAHRAPDRQSSVRRLTVEEERYRMNVVR